MNKEILKAIENIATVFCAAGTVISLFHLSYSWLSLLGLVLLVNLSVFRTDKK